MSDSPADSSSPDRHQQLHQRLLAGDAVASVDLARLFLGPLIDWLVGRNPRIDPDLVHQAADEAILTLIRKPASYDPGRGALDAYLRMSAQAKLKNLLRDEARHTRNRTRLEVVELSDVDGKYTGREDDPSLALMIEEELADLSDTVPESVRETLTEEESRVLELMQLGERRTAAFAEACGIADRSLKEQQLHVKQIKDRLKKRIERQGGS